MKLYDYQWDAINRMFTGCILCGGVGSGKSRTSLAYYFTKCDGLIFDDSIVKMDNPMNLYIITTARKRDTLEWDDELHLFGLSRCCDDIYPGLTVVVDSWNNIKKYADVENSFFIFDEQRVVGYGAWTKAFLKIAKKNDWILLTATPGDTWSDYIPVFIANGFYKNKTEFCNEHVVWSKFTTYPKIDRYVNVPRLLRLRDRLLIDMKFERQTNSHHEDIYVDYDLELYRKTMKYRFDFDKNEPIETASMLCYKLRQIVNGTNERINETIRLAEKKRRVIIFYNYDYELELLRDAFTDTDFEVGEWNGHKHQDIPDSPKWVYLVQYNAGNEGWNCIKTDTIIFYSQNYSYKIMIQAAGRIDRLNTPFNDLWYYHLKTRSSIDKGISLALKNKKDFNERRFIGGSHGRN